MSIYMKKRKPKFIKRGEISRDYYRHDVTPSDFLFPCDYDDEEEDY